MHVGKQVAAAEGRLYGVDGVLYAHASTTCLVFEVPAEKWRGCRAAKRDGMRCAHHRLQVKCDGAQSAPY